MNPAVAEYSVQLNYLQLMLDLPWESYTKDNLDLNHAKKRLDNDHFGLDEVKDRILEHLAVIKLKGGRGNGSNWVVLDYADIIVHVFCKDTREFYQLERLWADGELVDISQWTKPNGIA